MIFEAEEVERLIQKYKATEDEATLERIVEESMPLAEVIASKFDYTLRDDLVQECLAKMVSVLDYYDPDLGSSHKYFTSVFTNCCYDYISDLNKEWEVREELKIDPSYNKVSNGSRDWLQHEAILKDLTERNRRRFPSLSADTIDGATEHVLFCVLEGVFGKSRGTVKELCENYQINRHEAIIIYHSSLIYLRRKYRHHVDERADAPKEMSLLPDLKEIIGGKAYERIALLFSGTYLRFP